MALSRRTRKGHNVPAKAGTQASIYKKLGSRLRGNDGLLSIFDFMSQSKGQLLMNHRATSRTQRVSWQGHA